MRYARVSLSLLLLVSLLFLVGCGWLANLLNPQAPGYASSITDNYGRTVVTVEDKEIHALVTDEYGVPVSGVTVMAYAMGDDVLVFGGSEDYLPGIKIVTPAAFSGTASSGLPRLEPQLAVTTITLMVISAYGILSTFYEYWKNPGEFPIQIPGLIEGERRVKSICVQIDGNDIMSIGSAILSGLNLFKGIQVLGAPAKLRGVTAINLGITKKTVANKLARTVGKEFVKMVGILDSDIINTCTYEYETETGYEKLPYLTLDVQRLDDILKQFYIYVRDTNVKKGWDWIVLPDGKKINVTPGKYMLIQEIEPGRKWKIGFEDLTEELGYDPQCDYDYNEPLLEIEVIGSRQLLVKGLYFDGIYKQDLYFDGQLIYENFGAGTFENFGEWTVNF